MSTDVLVYIDECWWLVVERATRLAIASLIPRPSLSMHNIFNSGSLLVGGC